MLIKLIGNLQKKPLGLVQPRVLITGSSKEQEFLRPGFLQPGFFQQRVLQAGVLTPRRSYDQGS